MNSKKPINATKQEATNGMLGATCHNSPPIMGIGMPANPLMVEYNPNSLPLAFGEIRSAISALLGGFPVSLSPPMIKANTNHSKLGEKTRKRGNMEEKAKVKATKGFLPILSESLAMGVYTRIDVAICTEIRRPNWTGLMPIISIT